MRRLDCVAALPSLCIHTVDAQCDAGVWRTRGSGESICRYLTAMSLLVPSHRKPKFKVLLSIQDLTNVPLVSGLVHVRWHLHDSIRSEARGKTERSLIKDHKVEWGYENMWTVKMIIDKTNHLQEATLEFEVFQELYGGKERHALGKLTLNLAEYADSSEQIVRRYLLQDSKVNSTLKLGLRLDQLSGDTEFYVPELKRNQVFSGITGLLTEGKEIKKRDEEMGYGATQDSHAERVAIQLDQDIYRNSIVRKWQAQAGELDPSGVVDDIFDGSDGWTRPYDPHDEPVRVAIRRGSSETSKDDHLPRQHQHPRHQHDQYHESSRHQTDYRTRHFDSASQLDDEQPRDGPVGVPPDLTEGWSDERQMFEADEMLRSLTWTIDPVQVEHHVGKSLPHRAEELKS